MPLAKDLSKLPTAQPTAEPPIKKPVYAPLLAQAWADEHVDTPEHPANLPMAAAGARIRHSWAGACARLLGYRLEGQEPTNPLTLADYWRFGLGHVVHDAWQAALQKALPDAQVEVKVTMEDGMLAGHADAELERITFELKTINGFGFKKAVGARGPADGPRHSAKLQGALNAKAADADELVIIYTSLECLSVNEAKKIGADDVGRFCAEWHYPRSAWEPWADAEIERLLQVVGTVDAGLMPERAIPDPEIPDGAVIVDPSKGFWQVRDKVGFATFEVTDAGTTWHCNYCDQQKRCVADLREEMVRSGQAA